MSESAILSAVILARGLGKRMRKSDDTASLDESQARAADAGMKGMIPIGRPFLDYLISALADAGIERVCIVVGPEHNAVVDHYTRECVPDRVEISFALQQKALGREVPPAIAGFARSALISSGNVPPDRVTRFGALTIDDDGYLVRIVPRAGETPGSSGEEVYASMNCWSFDSRIFDACRRTDISPRGELELPRAVQLAIDTLGMRFKVVKLHLPVLDMSTRGDIASVTKKLKAINVRL